nr:ribonuclease H-like domain-containing protein [Tanacetum cinerariifolium]
MAFMSANNTSSTNDVSTAYSVSSHSVLKSQKEGSSSYTDEVIHSFFSNQSSAPQLDYDDLEQINDDDMEKMDLKWQVAMISMRIKKFHKRTGRKLQFDTKDLVGFDKTIVECFNCHKIRHFARDCRAKGNQDSRRRDDGYNGNKTRDIGRRPSYQDDSKALVTIDGEDIDWLLNTQMSANDKFGLGYGDYRYGSILSYANEVLQSVFMNKASDLEDIHVNDRYANGMHAVPPPTTGNYMPSGPDVEIDYFKFTYDPKQTSVDESDSKPSEYASCKSNSSVETTTSMPDPVENAPKVVCEPKVWTNAPIIEEYESDNDNDSVSNVQEDKEKPSFTFIDSVKHVKTSRENVKESSTPNHNPKIRKQGRNGHTRKGLGYAFTRKTCFVCGRKINFSKYIFDNMVRNVDNPNKFLMYPWFLKVIIDAQVDDLSSHNNQYTSYVLTQKVFAYMRRVDKGFSKVETPLFAIMLVQPQPPAVEEEDEVEGEKIKAINADEDITLVDVDTQVDMDAELQGRINDVSATATKDVNAAEPTVFDDEEVTMTMAQTLIKMKAEKARLLDEQMDKRLHDEEVEKAENIDWNDVAEQIQEKHLYNIRKYQSLKRKPVSIAQARNNMIIYLKNMAGYKMEHFRGMTYDKARPIFEREYNKVQTLFKLDKDVEESSKKKVVEETLLQESFKKLKAVEVSGSNSTQETPTNDHKEMSEEDVQNMLEIVPVAECKVKALQVKYPIIDWEIHSEGSRSYWKIIRVGGITEAYQRFEDMLKGFDREDLLAL